MYHGDRHAFIYVSICVYVDRYMYRYPSCICFYLSFVEWFCKSEFDRNETLAGSQLTEFVSYVAYGFSLCRM